MTTSSRIDRRSAIVACASVASFVTAFGTKAFAETDKAWPTRPIKLVVAGAPAGNIDLASRLITERMAAALGQPFVIENKGGAGGNLGTEAVLQAPPDGYTFLMGGSSTHAVNVHLYKLKYDPIADMLPIAIVGTAPNVLIVNGSLPVNTVQELVNQLKSRPGQSIFAYPGNGTSGHLASELFVRQARLEVSGVPYKGQSEVINAVSRGDVAFGFVTVAGTMQQVKAGRIKALGVTSTRRSALVPELPSIAQSGFPGFEVLAWYCLLAPKGTPPEIVARLTRELDKTLKDPAVAEKLQSVGVEANDILGPASGDFMKKESAKWGKVVREAGIGIN